MKGMFAEFPPIGSRAILTTQNCVCPSYCTRSSTDFCAHPKYKFRYGLLNTFQFHSLAQYGFVDRYSPAVFTHTAPQSQLYNILDSTLMLRLVKAFFTTITRHSDTRNLEIPMTHKLR